MAKRRANGEGSLYRTNDGYWNCQIMVGYKADGKRDIRHIRSKSQQAVIQKRDELKRKNLFRLTDLRMKLLSQ